MRAATANIPTPNPIQRRNPGPKTMRCIKCNAYLDDAMCMQCYEVAIATEKELKREIEDLKAKVSFLRFCSPFDYHHNNNRPSGSTFTDVVLVAASAEGPIGSPVPVPSHRAVLVSRSPVFRAMLENEMEESLSGTIKICDVSYDALRAFINFLYTAEACLDEQMAFDLLVLAEKYQVKHLMAYCEKFLVSKLNWDNSLMIFAFAHQHNAKHVLEAALSLIINNMDKLTKRKEYMEILENEPRLVVDIYEAYLSKQLRSPIRTLS